MKLTTNGLVFNLFSERNSTNADGRWERATSELFQLYLSSCHMFIFKEKSIGLTSHLTAILSHSYVKSLQKSSRTSRDSTHFPGAQVGSAELI